MYVCGNNKYNQTIPEVTSINQQEGAGLSILEKQTSIV